MAYLPAPRCTLTRARRGPLRRALCCLPIHCQLSDPVWEAYFEARSPAMRWMLWSVLRAAQATAILPSPPGRLRSLQTAAALVVAMLASGVAQRLFVGHVTMVLEKGFQIALHAYVVENFLEALQPPLILVVTWCNLARVAPVLAAIMATSGHLRPAPSFMVFTALLYLSHLGAQVLFQVTVFQQQDACFSVASAWAGFTALIMDRLVTLALTLAALKIQVVNRKLSSLPSKATEASTSPAVFVLASSSASWLPQEPPLVQRALLQTVANRWEDTMEQVSALLGHRMLGLPLLYSLLHMSIGLVTSSSLAIRDETSRPIRLIKLIDLIIYLARVASLALTAGWLYREAKETETILGALDTTGWPIRDRQRVNHLLHLSRETTRFRVCGIVSIDHSFLFSVMGNTVTFLVMLLQYPILTPGKAAAVLNKTETKPAT